MIQQKASLVGHQLEVLWTSGTLTGMSDAQLLGRFAGVRDATAESSFRELMHRHGPMVMGVCRQVLRRPHDADDAFQATFLVLVRKAGSIRVGESLAPWLYAVAFRTARRARAIASRIARPRSRTWRTRWGPCQRRVPLRHATLAARRAESAPGQVPRADCALPPRRQDA